MSADMLTIKEFEKQIAEYFGSPFAVAVDSCTHGIELCLRLIKTDVIYCPKHTYLSVPMLANKMGIALQWKEEVWQDYYSVSQFGIYDAAVYWKQGGYIPNTFMCLSFQYQKHLSLGRGGMILCPDLLSWTQLKKMSYDGRIPNIPWRDQNIDTMGYHYYMTPETAAMGLEKLPDAISKTPRQWVVDDWPDLTKMTVFKNTI